MLTLNSKKWTILLLMILMIVSGYYYGYAFVVPQIIVCTLATVICNSAIDYWRLKKVTLSDSAIITGMIIASVAAPNSSLWALIAVSVVAIVAKYLIKVKGRTLFNPAALGLLIAVAAFDVPMGWWIDHWHWLTIVTGAFLFSQYTGKWRIVFTFLLSFSVLTAARALLLGLPLIDELYFNVGTSLFFMFFMLSDPKTMPVLPQAFPHFAVIAAVATFVSVMFWPSSLYLLALLIANACTPLLNKWALNKMMMNASQVPSQPTTPTQPN